MKKFIFSSFALVAMMFAGTSCSSEEVAPVTDESTVTLSVTLPDGIQSRTFGDGTTAQKLTMLVLDENNEALSVFNGADVLNTDITLTKQVNLQLAAGKTYKVVCWAAAEGAPYTFDTTNFTVSANYEGAKTSDEALDAFYAVQSITVKGNTTETVKLYRPFAQLNIGTDDLSAAKAAGFEAETVTVTVPTYKSLNLLTGEVEAGDPRAVTFAANALPAGETFPKTGYDYLSMNYLLMSTDKQLVDVEFTVKAKDGATRTLPVNAVPVQRNYRTNIYGSLLTNSVNINVEIVPDFEGEDYNMDDAARIAATLSAGQSVKLDRDLDPGKTMAIELKDGASVELDLNGHTIANTGDLWNDTDVVNDWSLISVRGNGTLTIKGGTLKAKENDCFTFDVQDGGRLVIEDGTFISNLDAVYVFEGVCEIKGGHFDIQQKATGNNPYAYLLNCYDSAYKNGTAKFIVSGGTFVGYNPANSSSENPKANFLADGYIAAESVENGLHIFTVKKAETVTSAEVLYDLCYNKKGAVIYINTPIVRESGSAAYCYNGGTRTITLDKNGSLTSGKGCTLTVASGVTVNLNGLGGTITAPISEKESYNAALKVGGSRSATLNIFGDGKYIQPAGAKSGHALIITAGTANIYGGYFYAGKGPGTGVNAMSSTLHLVGSQGMSTCNIYGGVFECEGDAKYLLNCEDSYYKKGKCKFVVYGGIFVGFNPAESYSEGTSAVNWVADGYKVNKITYNGKEAYQVVKA